VNDWDDIPAPGPLPYDSPRETEASVPVPAPLPDELAETGLEAGLDWIGAAVLLVVGLAAVIRARWAAR
jgi:cytochrome oxidase assembly protein ShyY1